MNPRQWKGILSMAQTLNRKCLTVVGEEHEEPGAGAEIRVVAGKAEEFPGWSSELKCFFPWAFISSFKVIWWNLEWLLQK